MVKFSSFILCIALKKNVALHIMKQEAAVPAVATLSQSQISTQLSTEKLSGHLFVCGSQVFFLLTQDGNVFVSRRDWGGGFRPHKGSHIFFHSFGQWKSRDWA